MERSSPVLCKVVGEEGGHLVVPDGPVETPHQALFLHGQVEDGGIQGVVLLLGSDRKSRQGFENRSG